MGFESEEEEEEEEEELEEEDDAKDEDNGNVSDSVRRPHGRVYGSRGDRMCYQGVRARSSQDVCVFVWVSGCIGRREGSRGYVSGNSRTLVCP